MVTEIPIRWCGNAPSPYSLIGDTRWRQPLNITVDVMIESVGAAFVTIGVSRAGCIAESSAMIFSVNTTSNGLWQLSASTALTNPLNYGNIAATAGIWYTILLSILADYFEGYINGHSIDCCALNASSSSRCELSETGGFD